ncbi:MAG: UDP-glucose 4-epimerase [Actinomycetota bacterium]
MRALVCGGAGFIGSHLVDRLLADGHAVEVVDDLSTGSFANLGPARAAGGELKIHNIDVTAPEFLDLVSLRRPDVIYQMTALSPASAHAISSVGSAAQVVAALEAARLFGASKVVVGLPATLLYGEVAVRDIPAKEGKFADAVNVPNVIARTILDLLGVYREVHAVEYTALAVSNVYGPRQRAEDGVVASFAAALAAGEAPEMYGTGRQTRDFIHVDDVVDAYVRAATKGDGLLINIGTGVQTSIAALWKAMSGASGLRPTVVKARPGDISRFAISPVRARIHLAWAPFTDLNDGLGSLLGGN